MSKLVVGFGVPNGSDQAHYVYKPGLTAGLVLAATSSISPVCLTYSPFNYDHDRMSRAVLSSLQVMESTESRSCSRLLKRLGIPVPSIKRLGELADYVALHRSEILSATSGSFTKVREATRDSRSFRVYSNVVQANVAPELRGADGLLNFSDLLSKYRLMAALYDRLRAALSAVPVEPVEVSPMQGLLQELVERNVPVLRWEVAPKLRRPLEEICTAYIRGRSITA